MPTLDIVSGEWTELGTPKSTPELGVPLPEDSRSYDLDLALQVVEEPRPEEPPPGSLVPVSDVAWRPVRKREIC